MRRFPIEPSEVELTEASEIGKAERVVPFGRDGTPVVRIEHLPATKWRVLGLHSQVSAGHETEAQARKAMADYLAGIRYVMPSAEVQAAELKRHEEKMADAEADRAQSRRTMSKK